MSKLSKVNTALNIILLLEGYCYVMMLRFFFKCVVNYETQLTHLAA